MDVQSGPDEGMKVDIITGMTNGTVMLIIFKNKKMLLIMWYEKVSVLISLFLPGLSKACGMIVILSQKYEESQNCRTELHTAYGNPIPPSSPLIISHYPSF